MKNFLVAALLGLFAALGMPGLAWAAVSCAPATTRGTAPADYKDYCWLDFSTYSEAAALNGTGQSFTFTLPDLSTLRMTLNTQKGTGVSTTATAITPVAVPSWSGSAFGNVAFSGIPGKPILYTGTNNSTVTVTMSGISIAPPPGSSGQATYALIVGDGESTNGGETLSFTTNGGNWTQLANIPNGSSYPGVSGVGTNTVNETGVAGTVGSYVFGSFNNPTQISSTFKGSGLQGIIVGVRYASISVVSNIVGQRYNAPDQFTYAIKTNTGTVMASAATSGTALSGFTSATMPTVAASYPFKVEQTMASGSTGTLANYSVSLSCVNTRTSVATVPTVLPSNSAVNSYTITSLQYGDAVDCTFTNTPIFSPVTGTVYADANHNNSQDGTETGTGVSSLYVKLTTLSGGSCQTTASTSALVNATTGAYSLPAVVPGNYCLILDNNGNLSETTSNPPAGWLVTQNASGVIQLSVDSFPPETPQNFGLYNGSKLSGTVFADTGIGSGSANNGTKDGSEAGIASVTVNATVGASAVASASTAGDGSYTLWVAASATGSVVITPVLPSGYMATGGAPGTTNAASGTYSRPSVTYTAPAVAGKTYTGVNFGLVPPNTLAPNGAQTAQPGTVVFYAHAFYAGSAGSITFSLAGASTPSTPDWSQVLYQDVGCTGTLTASSPLITALVNVTVGQTLCVSVKQFVPASATLGAQNTVTLNALFSYTGASPALSRTLSATDVTTVDEPGALALNKRVSNLTQGGPSGLSVNAKPGETLQYLLTAINNGSEPLSLLVINDATPAFTTFYSAACPATLTSGLTACNLTQQPVVGAAGSVQWTFTGSLAPSAQFSVSYEVKVNN